MSLFTNSRADEPIQFGGWTAGQWLAVVALCALMLMGSDILMRANGWYGERHHVSAPIVEKRIEPGRRNSRSYQLHIVFRGQRAHAVVTHEEFERRHVGQPIRWVIIPGRIAGFHVFEDGPGLKLDPQTRVVLFGLIVGSHFLALLGLFVWLVRRAERA